VVGCGFDPEVFARPAAPATDGAPPLLAVGRLVRAKGFDQMLEAVALLRREGEPTRAVIVGDGPERDGLEALAARLGVQDLVTFAGAVGHDEIRRFYADARIVCVPSLAEGLPVVLMEAMAVGRPVVATRITGVPELVEDGVSGLLVTPGRPRELAAALRALLTDPAMRERLSEAGRAKVLQDHDVGRSAERLERLFMDPAGLSS
jgi:glycosyltransferase involved in cell wall biosynthesis